MMILKIEAKLRFWEDGEPSVLKIEDDAYYGSDFTRMIILLSIIDSDYKYYDEIEQIYVSTQIVEGRVISEDNIDNCLDDGTTWAEAWLRHPKLDHLVITSIIRSFIATADFGSFRWEPSSSRSSEVSSYSGRLQSSFTSRKSL